MARSRNIDDEFVLQVAKESELTKSFLVLMLLSGVLAAVAFAASSVPLLLGAMIVAPVFPPLGLVVVGLAGGQRRFAARGLGTATLGLLLSAGAAIGITYLLEGFALVPRGFSWLDRPLLEERVRPGWYSLIAAFAAGIAGTLALLQKKTETLIGTVAAVALVPAAAAGGIALAQGDPIRALGGLILLACNMGLIVAMGLLVVVFTRRARSAQSG